MGVNRVGSYTHDQPAMRPSTGVMIVVGVLLAGCGSKSAGEQASIATQHPIGWAARTCASALAGVHTRNVLAEAYPTPVNVYLTMYRIHSQPSRSAFRGRDRHSTLAICLTMRPRVAARYAHGPAREDCPLGSFPSALDFDNIGEQFYGADVNGTTEQVSFAPPPAGHPPGCFAGVL